MASAARIPSRNTTALPPGNPPREGFLYPPLPMNTFPMETPLEQRERFRALEARQQRELAMNRRFGEEIDRERALLFDRERVERMMERDRMAPRIGGPSRIFERERMSGGVERPIRMDGPLGVMRLESGSGSSRLENMVGLDRRPENPVGVLGADRRLENGVERGLSNPVAVDRRLEAGIERRLETAAVIERRMDSGVDRRLEPAVDGDDDRNGPRPPVRPATFERMRSTDRERERDEERDKLRERAREDEKLVGTGEKQKERDDSAGAMQELVTQYKTALAELTFNSKPIITNLTIIAGENLHASKVIAATVCAHILEVPVEQKLPSLYLLDSIVKNIGSSYVKQFAARLPEVFIKAYRQVDPATYPAMQHLFKTWRGVFPSEPLRIIEAELQFNFMVNGTSSSNPTRAEESPTQRPGNSIHVNPKYLEAQRQKLQQSSQANSLPTQIQRSDSISGESNPVRKSTSNISDYDYGPADPGVEGGGSSGGREKTWERGWPREGEDSLRTPDSLRIPDSLRTPDSLRIPDSLRTPDPLRTPESSASARYGLKNGYELRQPSPRALVDAYGNIRGIRTSRFPPVPVQPTQDFDGRARNLSRNWQNSEEEEYIWEDISPRLLDITRHGDSLRKDKDDWYPGDADKNAVSGGALGGTKPFGLDQPLSDHPGWRRHGPLSSMDRPAPIDSRVMRETDERASLSNLQQDIVPRLVPDSLLEASSLGPSGRPMMASRPLTGRLPHPLAQQPSPPPQSRLRPFQMSISSRNSPPSGLGSINQGSQSINLMGPTSGSGTSTIQGPTLAGRSGVRPNMGSLGGGLLNYGSLSSATPASGLNFHHRQQPQRPPSPPPLASLSQRLLPPPSLNAPLQHQPNLPAVPQHVISSKHVHHQSQAPGMQPHSSQQPLSLPPLLQQPPPVQQLPQQPPSVHQSPQQLQPLHNLQPQQMLLSHSTAEQAPVQQPSQTVPMPPQLPAQLLESLQQLQHHLPPLSGNLPQASQPLRNPFQLQSPLQQSQSTLQTQQSQKPLTQPVTQQTPQPPQTLSHATASISSVVNDNPSTLLSGPQNHGGTSNLLAAFLRSGLMPPSQASQMLSHPQSSSTNVPGGPSEPTIAQSSQVQPPLPSGPPPIQYPASGTGPSSGKAVLSGPPAASTSPSNLASLAALPSSANLPPVYSSMRSVQPPLPPGPPPMSSQVASSTSQLPSFAEPPGNNLTSLLSSLMEQGVISAHSSVPPILPQLTGVAPNVSVGATFASPSLNLLSSGGLPVPPSGSSAPLATVVSTTLVTAFRTQEPSATAIVAPTETTTTSDLGATEFRQELLRERQEPIINALYFDFPRQCKTCGLRFKYQEEHSKHMDWHVSKNRRQKSSKKVSRKWFVSVKEWLNGTGAAASDITPSFFAEEVAVKPEDHEAVAVPADETQSACALCGEPFDDFYSDETEEWMYRGAVYMNAPPDGVTEGLDKSLLGPIVHAKCRSESAASAVSDLTEDAELDEEDGLGLRRKRVRY